MLEKAFKKIPDGTNLILHSDQGWQYKMYDYQRRLKEKGIRQSMSRKRNCLDNSVMENFFGLLKSELLYLQEFKSIEHFKKELIEYLSWYNEKRITTTTLTGSCDFNASILKDSFSDFLNVFVLALFLLQDRHHLNNENR